MPGAVERVFVASPGTGPAGQALAAPWFFSGEDHLRVVVVNSQPGIVVGIQGRFLSRLDSGKPVPITETLTPTADRLAASKLLSLGEGFLLNLSAVVVNGAPKVGQTYVMVQVIRGFTGATIVLGCLLGGYVTAVQHIAYPGSPIVSSTDGEPFVRVVAGTTPAAGAEIAETVPTNARWELVTMQFALTPSGAGVARLPFLVLESPAGARLGAYPAAATVGPALGLSMSWGQNLPAQNTSSFISTQPFAQGVILPAGAMIRSLTSALDPGDQYANVTALVREWLEAA